jgi:hypothetical protein
VPTESLLVIFRLRECEFTLMSLKRRKARNPLAANAISDIIRIYYKRVAVALVAACLFYVHFEDGRKCAGAM